MNEMPAGIGHNLGPIQLETRDELAERLEREDRALFDRVTELELGAQQIPATIPNEEIAAQVTTDIAKYHLVISDLEARHKRLKAPYFAIGRWLDERYLGRAKTFRAATARADRALDLFRRQKERRQREAEQAARLRAAEEAGRAAAEQARLQVEAAAREAEGNRRAAIEAQRAADRAATEAAHQQALSVMPDQPVAIHGLHGATAYGVRKWDIEIVDPEILPRNYWMPDYAAIEAELKMAIAATGKPPEIPGVAFVAVDTTRVRRC